MDVAAIGLNAEHEHIPLVGDSPLPSSASSRAMPHRCQYWQGARDTCRETRTYDLLSTAPRQRQLTFVRHDLQRTRCRQPLPVLHHLAAGEHTGGHDRYGRRFTDAYAALLRDAPDVALTRPSKDEAADGLLHVLFPFEAWDEKLNFPRHDVRFPFVPVCNLVVARAARCPGADQLRREIGQAGDE